MSSQKSVLGEALNTTPRPGRRNRRFTPEERQADIIRVATLLISEKGYYGFTLQAVAAGCNMTRAGVLHYFRSKDDLLISVLENRDRVDLNQTRISNQEDFVADPRARLDALVQRNEQQPELVRLYTTLNAESLTPEHPAHRYYNERYPSSIGIIARILRGHFDDPVDVAGQIVAIMDGIQMQWLRFPEQHTLTGLWTPLADAVFAQADPTPVPDVS